jgi:hypothetical protein
MSVTDDRIKSTNGTGICGKLGPDLHPVTILTINTLTTNFNLNLLDESVANVVEPAEALRSASSTAGYLRENNLNVCLVHEICVTVDDCSHTLVEICLTVERHFNRLYREVGVTLVKNLPESDLRITRDVDILGAVADKLHKTTTHFVVMIHTKKKF